MLSKAYQLLAVRAAETVGLSLPAAASMDDRLAAVASDPDAAAQRDASWLEYDAMLRDESYTLDRVRAFLAAAEISVGLSSVARDRQRLMKEERRVGLVDARVKTILGAMDQGDTKTLHRQGVRLVMTQLLDTFLSMGADGLTGLKPGQLVDAMEVFSRLGRTLAETDRIRLVLDEKRKAAKAAVDAAAGPAGDGRLGREDVYKILDDVMKGAA